MRYYSSNAGAMTLQVAVSSSDTTLSVNVTTGLPTSYPYTVVVDVGTAQEEIVRVDSASGTNLTVVRGQDGTSGQAHGVGATVRHMATAQDFREPQQHIAASSAVHGVTGSVVGTSDTQSLDNKTFVASGTDHTPLTVKRRQAGDASAVMRVQDETGVDLFQWSTVGMNVRDTAAGISGEILTPNGANLSGYVARFRSLATGVVGLIVRRITGQTANMLEFRDNNDTTVLAKFDSGANLTVPSVTSTGGVTGVAGTFSGAVSGTTGTFSGQVKSNGVNVVTLSEAQTLGSKTLTAPTVTGTMAAGSATFSGTVFATSTVNGSNLAKNVETGVVNITSGITAGSFSSLYTITFTPGKFSTAPKVVANCSSGRGVIGMKSASTTSVQFEIYNASGSSISGTGEFVTWMAMEV